MPLFRFDDTYEKIYEFSEVQGAHIYISSYAQSGISAAWSEMRKNKQMARNFIEWHHGPQKEMP
jgi:hypothetical protein